MAQGVIGLHASEESPVLVLARANPRRHCEQLFVAAKINVEKISDSPTVRYRKALEEFSLPESALAFRVEVVLDLDYFLKTDVSFGEISHGQPVLAEKKGERVLLTLNPEGQSVRLLLDLFRQDISVFSGMVKDFVRNIVFPRVADFVPSSTRQGAEAFLKAIRKSRELFEYGDHDLGNLPQIWEDQRDGRITVDQAVELSKMAVRTNVQYVETQSTAHAIAVASMRGGLITPCKDIRAGLVRKSRRYGAMDSPYLIVVADAKEQLFSAETVRSALTEAVFGDEIAVSVAGKLRLDHARNGFWNGTAGPQNKQVSGVLLLPKTSIWELREPKWQPLLAVNPWAAMPLPEGLKTIARLEAEGARWIRHTGTNFADILAVPEPWPPE
jgi:hypothetical protein